MKLGNKMKCLVINDSSGWRNVSGDPVVILDENHQPFYDTTLLDHKVWEFNMPPGTYYVQQGKIRQTPHMVAYNLERIAPYERRIKSDPETFPIIYEPNSKLASVYWDAERSPYGKQVIVLDSSLRTAPLIYSIFVLYHEYGHRYWETEAHCDAYARNRMLQEGYNPSQIGYAIVHTLSDKNMQRKDAMIDSLLTA